MRGHHALIVGCGMRTSSTILKIIQNTELGERGHKRKIDCWLVLEMYGELDIGKKLKSFVVASYSSYSSYSSWVWTGKIKPFVEASQLGMDKKVKHFVTSIYSLNGNIQE
jgi:hypothetical protein